MTERARSDAKPPARKRPTSFERTAPRFEPAALATPEGKRKAIHALRAVRKRKTADDDRWTDRCLELLVLPRAPGYQPALRELFSEALATVVHLKDARAATKLLAMLEITGHGEPPLPLLVGAIGRLGVRTAVEPLVQWFNRRNVRQSERVYREIADALVRLADAEVVARIRRALEHDAPNRYQAWAYEKALESIRNGTGPTHTLGL